MKIKYDDGTLKDVTTGIARRLIQAGEAVEYSESDDDDKRKPAARSTRSAKDRGGDVSGD